MVCKEDVLTWFKDLDSYQRIDVMYELLNMCGPFEVRFLGTCIEEIGKHNYQELRGPTIIANDIDKLSRDASLVQSPGLLDECVRHRILIYISLLSARNCTCANWFYKNLLSTNKIEDYVVKNRCKDDNVQNEFLLLYTLALHHPAFTFEQKSVFGKLVTELLEQKEGKLQSFSKANNYCYPPGFGYPKLPPHSEIPAIPVKTASPVTFVESRPIPKMFSPHSTMVPHHMDFITQPVWPRPPFPPANVCPEPMPLLPPPPPTSPLINESTSSPSTRPDTPPRLYTMRPTCVMQPGHIVDVVPPPSTQLDTVSQTSSLPAFIPDGKPPEEDVNHLPDDKARENNQWPNPGLYDYNMQNGIRFPFGKYQNVYLLEPFQALTLESENSLHCSSSSSRSGTPPETPSTTPAVIPQGPGRGDVKSRVNGIPPFLGNPQMCDASQAPPPPYSNCSVPYSTFPPLSAIPSRFTYSQPRFPFNATFSYQPPDNFSSYQYPFSCSHPIQRTIYCYNCGANNHAGAECSGQTIEDITQKPYVLEYLSDVDKT